ncbi:MAG: hypothetical protein WBP61_18105 [Nocardioides sp.]
MSARLLASAGALALVTVLSSCGFDLATDRDYTPAAGVNEQDAIVDVLGATIVSAQEGSGTFIATFSNNDQDAPATVESMTGEGLVVEEFEPIEIAPGGLLNLALEGGIPVTGEFVEGNFVAVQISFGDGRSVEMQIPVSPNCNEYAGLDESGTGGDEECELEELEPVEH